MVAIQSQILTRTLAAFAPAPAQRPKADQPQEASKPDHAQQPADTVELSPEARDASAEAAPKPGAPTGQDGTPLTQDQTREITELKSRDAEVRAHEQAHLSAAGGLATGGASYETQRGPDGKDYAVGGSVPIDYSPISGEPKATIAKMQQVRRAALAPGDPSSADRSIAAKAGQLEAKAQQELAEENTTKQSEATEQSKPESNTETEQDPASLDLGYTATGSENKLQIEHRLDLAA